MIRKSFALYLLLFCVILSGCGKQSVTKPVEIEDATSYTNDGLQAYAESDWNKAQWLFNRALSLYEGIDDQQGVLHSHINLAEVALSEHNYPVSLNHLNLAGDIAKTKPNEHYHARITLLYALIALQQKQIDRAERLLQLLLPGFDGQIPNAIQVTAVAVRTKIAFIHNKDEALWTNRYANALKLSNTYPQDLTFRLLRFKSLLLQQKGKYAEAELNLQQSLAGYKTILNRQGIAATLLELGQLYKKQERWEEARYHFDRSKAVFRYLRDLGKVDQIKEYLLDVNKALEK